MKHGLLMDRDTSLRHSGDGHRLIRHARAERLNQTKKTVKTSLLGLCRRRHAPEMNNLPGCPLAFEEVIEKESVISFFRKIHHEQIVGENLEVSPAFTVMTSILCRRSFVDQFLQSGVGSPKYQCGTRGRAVAVAARGVGFQAVR